jgi:hypothetical protein
MGSGASAMSAHSRAKGGAEGPLSPQDAANLMLECVYEFNACVPYAGVSAVGAGEGFELEPLAVTAVLALLPEELQPGLPPPALAPDDVKQVRKVLLLHAYTFLSISSCAPAVPGLGQMQVLLTICHVDTQQTTVWVMLLEDNSDPIWVCSDGYVALRRSTSVSLSYQQSVV